MTMFNIDLPIVEHNGVSFDADAHDLESVSRAVAYFYQYGFAKSLQDSVAGVKKALQAFRAGKANDKQKAIAEPFFDQYGEDAEIDEILNAEMSARLKDVLTGTLNSRGPRLTSEASIRRDVINEFFRRWAKKRADAGQGRLPRAAKGATKEEKRGIADKIAALREKFAAHNEAKISAEVERRVALQAEGDDLELDF